MRSDAGALRQGKGKLIRSSSEFMLTTAMETAQPLGSSMTQGEI
jgi:hypothetical protein